MNSTITIFYSWQCDLNKDTNQYGIRDCIESALTSIEKTLNNINLHKEEATSNSPGSPNIPEKIFEKISTAHIFICDLTCVTEFNNKKFANPNVLIELGYAISELGWDRILLLFNTEYGNIPNDLPFDTRTHRATPFKIVDKSDNKGKSDLTEKLIIAIKLIIKESPKKPHEKKIINPEVLKRNRDLENLQKILNNIHIATFDAFIEEAPSFIVYDFLHYYEGFSEMYKSNTFHIHNFEVLDLIKKVYDNLEIALSLKFAHHYFMPPNSRRSKFTYPNDEKGYHITIKDFEILLNNNEQLKKNFNILIKYVRENYLEINLEETSKIAFNDYASYQSDYEK